MRVAQNRSRRVNSPFDGQRRPNGVERGGYIRSAGLISRANTAVSSTKVIQ